MTYRDRTFCRGDGCAKFATCPHALTDAVSEGARKWWGGPGAPISEESEPSKLACYEAPKKPEGTP